MSAVRFVDIEREFNASLPFPEKLEPHLEEALCHVLENPGSLVRPRIVFQMVLAFGMGIAAAKDLAIALEYFHTASLLFDDLPCMDNALERRGSPCVHVEYGEAPAILSALALINRAYALTWRALSTGVPGRQSRAITYIERQLGLEGALNGQSLDLHYATLSHDEATTQRIAIGKTVPLIRLTLVLPAILGGASEREIHQLERLSMHWGLSYQILDDLKDVLRTSHETGKTVARDVLLNRPNMAVAIGLSEASKRLNRLIKLGDKTLTRMLQSRPSLAFMKQLRADMQRDMTEVIRETFDVAVLEPQ
jgi:geranylgeranyl pyrophosphate synthase